MGLKSCYDYFSSQGHTHIKIFLPSFRQNDPTLAEPGILKSLEKFIVWTPSRSSSSNKRTICYDDRFILNAAVDSGGVVVSNDGYRDLLGEREEFRKVVGERTLMYSFVDGR